MYDIETTEDTVTCASLKPVLVLQGVIRDSQDLQMLGPEFRDAYKQRQIDPFDESAWDQSAR